MIYQSLKYKTSLSQLEIQEEISKRIVSIEDNKLSNHLFPKDSESKKVRGKINANSFVLWITDSFLYGSGYPICKGEITENGEFRILKLNFRFNPVSEITLIILNLFLLYGVITGVIIQENNEFTFIWKRILVVILIFLLLNSVPIYIYYSGKRKLFEVILNTLVKK